MTSVREYRVRYKGQEYILSLRTCDDGYVSGYERSAVELIVTPFLMGAFRLSNEFYADESRVNRLLNLILTEGSEGGWLKGDKFIPLPWRSWCELDETFIRECSKDFFYSFTAKTQRLNASLNTMGVDLIQALKGVSDLMMWSGSTMSRPRADFETRNGHIATAADTPSSDTTHSKTSVLNHDSES